MPAGGMGDCAGGEEAEACSRSGRAMTRAALTLALLTTVIAGCGHSQAATAPTQTTAHTLPNAAKQSAAQRTRAPRTPAQRLGFPALKPGPVPGYLMNADRDNNRIIIVNPHTKKPVWKFPRSGDLRPGQSFSDPDDAFFTPGYRAISTNEEFNQTIGEIAIRTHRLVWSFGHPGVRGSAFGYLSNRTTPTCSPTTCSWLPTSRTVASSSLTARTRSCGRSATPAAAGTTHRPVRHRRTGRRR